MPFCDRNQKREQQAIPAGVHGRVASLRVLQPRVSGRLQPRPRETLETFLPRRRAVDRRGSDAAELRTDAAAGRKLARPTAKHRSGKADDLPRIHRGRPGCAEISGAESARTLLQSAARGVPTPNNVEPVERIHLGIQGTRSDPPIPGNREAGRVPGSSVLTSVLAYRSRNLFL